MRGIAVARLVWPTAPRNMVSITPVVASVRPLRDGRARSGRLDWRDSDPGGPAIMARESRSLRRRTQRSEF